MTKYYNVRMNDIEIRLVEYVKKLTLVRAKIMFSHYQDLKYCKFIAKMSRCLVIIIVSLFMSIEHEGIFEFKSIYHCFGMFSS